MALKSSSGLIIDLGQNITPEQAENLYQFIWSLPEFSGPENTMYEFMGVPRAAEGKIYIGSDSGSCYTKLEKDSLGYSQDNFQPILLTISIYNFEESSTTSEKIFDYTLELAEKIYSVYQYSLAIIGDVSLHFINSKLLHESWIDYYNDLLQGIILEENHAFRQTLAGKSLGANLYYYDQSQLHSLKSDKSAKEKSDILSQWAHSQFDKITI